MKFRPLLLLALVFVSLCSMSSCVKKYTCHCDIKYTGMPGLPDSTAHEFDISDTKSGAKSKCEAETGDYTRSGIRTIETCYLY